MDHTGSPLYATIMAMQRRLVLTLLFCLFLVGGVSFHVHDAHAQPSATVQDQSSAVNANNPVPEGSLVPGCPTSDPTCQTHTPYSPSNYGPCEFVQLINNILRFLIGISAIIGVVMFMYAGFLLVTSQGSPGQITKAKGIFTNVVIGFVVMLSAFLIVNTILTVLVGGNPSLLHWNTISCVYENQVGTPAAYNIPLTQAQIQAVNNAMSSTDPALLQQTKAGSCESSLINGVWGNLSNTASCIIRHESSCGGQPFSGTDITLDGKPFSIGAMQVDMTVHDITACQSLGISNLPCTKAFNGTDFHATVIDQTLYTQCKDALLNPQCNFLTGKQIYNHEGWHAWTTHIYCGV